MAALSDGGMGHREIAAALGVSSSTVDTYVACVKKGASARSHLFSEVLKEVRGGWGHEPRSVEGKAKAVASFVKDPEVFANPEVIKALTARRRRHGRPYPTSPSGHEDGHHPPMKG
jgi:hypothetical protein